MGARAYYETPALHAACVYLRRDAIELVVSELGADTADASLALNRLARRWRALGWQCVLCDYVYVGYSGPPLPDAPGIDDVEAKAFARHSPLGALRRAVADAIKLGLPPVSAPALDARPVQLHIMHFWGGGLDKWVRDFSRADTKRTNLILATYRIGDEGGQRIVLYSDPDAKVPIRTWDIARPLRSTAVASLEYQRILEQVVREFQVESIIVSSLIGHSLEALRQPVKTVVVAHDFYPLCQAINPRFDAVCGGCEARDLGRCSARNPHYEILGSPPPDEWNALREAYVQILLERGIEIVAPTPSVARTFSRLEPRLANHSLRVIGHGIDFRVAKLEPQSAVAGEPLRLVVLGRLAENKGADLLEAASEDLRDVARITLVGGGPHATAIGQRCGWEAIEKYELAELPAILGDLAPHAGLLASVVPETFSYTLSELWALGIPPIATRLGSFVDRIQDGVDGFLFEPRADALTALLRALVAQPARLNAVARAVGALPAQRNTSAMVEDYHALLPLTQRAVARFEVGIGAQTALTDPYRLLDRAYTELMEAYSKMSQAYASRTAAYDHSRAEFERAHGQLTHLLSAVEEFGGEFDRLRLTFRWWRAAEAQQLLNDMRRKINAGHTP